MTFVHDAAQHHADACKPGEGDTYSQQVDEMTCPACLRYLVQTLGATVTPYEPRGLRDLIGSLTYKTGWSFFMQVFREDPDEPYRGWRFHVISCTEDSMQPGKVIRVNHAFPIPPTSWNRDTWQSWLFDRVRDVETHEAGEFFRIDGERVLAPHHSNGEDPYTVWRPHTDMAAAKAKAAGDD